MAGTRQGWRFRQVEDRFGGAVITAPHRVLLPLRGRGAKDSSSFSWFPRIRSSGSALDNARCYFWSESASQKCVDKFLLFLWPLQMNGTMTNRAERDQVVFNIGRPADSICLDLGLLEGLYREFRK